MAGAIVHKEFFKECIVKSEANNLDDINNLNVFAQGHDLLLYASPLNFLKNRNISLILSNYKFREFVYAYLKIILKNNFIYQDKSVKSFLYGYISHHILDSYFHPFIMQYAPDYIPIRKKTWLHGEIETLYDTLFLTKKLKISLQDHKIYKDFCCSDIISKALISTIDTAIDKTYNIKNCGKHFKRAFYLNSRYMRLYRYDPNGIKKKFAAITNPIVKLGADKFFYDERELPKLEKYINSNHQEWRNIWNNERFNDSFYDIYSKAIADTVNSIKQIESILKTREIDKDIVYNIVPDRSAITGVQCGISIPFIKY